MKAHAIESTTPTPVRPLNRLALFRQLVCDLVARRGGTAEDQQTATAWTLALDESAVPPAIGLAAQRHVDAILPELAGCERRRVRLALVPARDVEQRLRHPLTSVQAERDSCLRA